MERRADILLLVFDFLLGNHAIGFMLPGKEIEEKCKKLHLLKKSRREEHKARQYSKKLRNGMSGGGGGSNFRDIGKDVSLPHRTATNSEEHTASYTMGKRSNFSG